MPRHVILQGTRGWLAQDRDYSACIRSQTSTRGTRETPPQVESHPIPIAWLTLEIGVFQYEVSPLEASHQVFDTSDELLSHLHYSTEVNIVLSSSVRHLITDYAALGAAQAVATR